MFMAKPGTTLADVTTGTLRVPDGELYYEVRGSGPLLVIASSPLRPACRC